MQQIAEEDGFRFLVIVFPMFWQLDENYPFPEIHSQILVACQDAGCEAIDLLDVFGGRDAADLQSRW